MQVRLAGEPVLARTLMRRKKPSQSSGASKPDNKLESVDLGALLSEIAHWAEKFVPSESGSILLDDPVLKADDKKEGRLYFTACFGKKAEEIAGTFISANMGIAGETYTSGKSYLSKNVASDDKFDPQVDKKIQHTSHSIVCVPIFINKSVIGVIELVNRKHKSNFDQNDLTMLEIFAGYTANLIKNSLAARDFEEMSKRDNLTGLYNDRYFLQRLEEEVVRAEHEDDDTSLIFLDLDRFKEINDTYGHLAGSALLKEVGGIVAKVFRDTPAVSARYGGDEYAIILPGMPLDIAAKYAEILRAELADHTYLSTCTRTDVHPLCIKGVITASVGVASQLRSVVAKDESSLMSEALLRAADEAMYKAKDSGKNKVCLADE